MNKKDKLYYDLIEAYRNHSCNDTLMDTYIYKVLKLVKDYLNFDGVKKQLKELKYEYGLVRKKKEKCIDNLCIRNQKLEKALDKACERLNWDCPVSQDLIADLDCENRCSDDFEECCKECWKLYFLGVKND